MGMVAAGLGSTSSSDASCGGRPLAPLDCPTPPQQSFCMGMVAAGLGSTSSSDASCGGRPLAPLDCPTPPKQSVRTNAPISCPHARHGSTRTLLRILKSESKPTTAPSARNSWGHRNPVRKKACSLRSASPHPATRTRAASGSRRRRFRTTRSSPGSCCRSRPGSSSGLRPATRRRFGRCALHP